MKHCEGLSLTADSITVNYQEKNLKKGWQFERIMLTPKTHEPVM